MKVLHIFDAILPSGAETMWTHAVPTMGSSGVVMHAVNTKPELGRYAATMQATGVKVFHIPHSGSAVCFDWRYCAALFKLIRTEKYDAVQIHPEGWRFTNFAVAYLAGVRHITTTIHAYFPKSAIRRIRRPVVMKTMQALGCKIIAISESVLRNEQSYHYRPLLIWNWVDIAALRCAKKLDRGAFRGEFNLPDDSKIVMVVGNCAPVKNHNFIIDVLSRLPSEYHLVHIGRENEEVTHERQHAAELKQLDRIRFLGSRTDVAELLSVADVFAACSTREGFGVAPVEALASGVPTVVSNVPGLIDLHKNVGAHCFAAPLVADEFACAIVQAAECQDSVISEGVSRVSDMFSLVNNVCQYVRLWRS